MLRKPSRCPHCGKRPRVSQAWTMVHDCRDADGRVKVFFTGSMLQWERYVEKESADET